MNRRLDRDLMNMAAPRRVANCIMATLDTVQNWRPEEQVLGAAGVFLALAEKWGVPAQDAFTAVTNLMNSKDGQTRPEFAGLRAYVEYEL